MPVASRPAPGLPSSPMATPDMRAASPARFTMAVSNATDNPSFRFAVEILPPPVKILLASLCSNLTGYGWISLGKTKKYSGGFVFIKKAFKHLKNNTLFIPWKPGQSVSKFLDAG